ncbi:MAG TPA: pilus assembly protein PilM, partial [Candidatus Limnocylindrales bacterium]|nr:pilus assembly protein PilM [Candidatus Limnocylindrales bacterium]
MGLFGLGKKQTTFGLDIGSSAVKVVELREGRGGYVLQAFATVPLPRDVIGDGSIKDPAVVTEAIRECVEKAGIKGTAAAISISGREGITKRVPLPK